MMVCVMLRFWDFRDDRGVDVAGPCLASFCAKGDR